ncbi:NAD-dependent epimerase/dehydratase family protein [Stappia stellulata]|uniref:NAD-dependent epimerase/dehydratase family protein n=1 Tax=Stappia stellulata TaxID=71235 RepID=UPI0003F75A09|nr:NAD(P)-dependent oxidoreductase [Stappia stellulata]
MRVLVTGGTGFVGLSLAECLLAQGHGVRLLAPSAPAGLLEDPALSGVEVRLGDIRDRDTLAEAMGGVDAVAHLAAITPDKAYETENPMSVVDVNAGGTASLMHGVALHAPKARILLVSSVAVYGTGDPVGNRWDEVADPLAPASLYGITKQAAEQLARYLARLNGLDLVIGRLGPVFGPWEHASGVRPFLSPHTQALALALAGQEVVLPRALAGDWLYSRDAGRALAGLLSAGEASGGIFNVGAGAISRVSDWCAALSKLLPELRWRLAEPGDAANVHLTLARDRAPLAVNRLHALVPLRPSGSLADCVRDHLAWMESHPNAVPLRRNEH